MVIKKSIMSWIIPLLVLSLVFILLVDTGHAKHKVKKVIVKPRVVKHGKIIYRLPSGSEKVTVGGINYFYHNGIYYRRTKSGYKVAKAPLNAEITRLPTGYKIVHAKGKTYYSYNGVYYKYYYGKYVVVPTPSGVVLKKKVQSVTRPVKYLSGKLAVKVSSLNIRSGPGTKYPVIDRVHKNQVLSLRGKSRNWFYVRLPNKKHGWIVRDFVKIVK